MEQAETIEQSGRDTRDGGMLDTGAAVEAVKASERNGEGVEQERFEIQDLGGVNWYLKQLRNLETEKATVQAQTAAMLKSLDADIHRLEFMYQAQAQTVIRAELARRGGKSKTLPLHQGTVAFRTVPRSYRVRGTAEAIEFARKHGWNVVKRVESLDAEAYKKEALAILSETGEVIPGIEVTEERETFTIKFGAARGTGAQDSADPAE